MKEIQPHEEFRTFLKSNKNELKVRMMIENLQQIFLRVICKLQSLKIFLENAETECEPLEKMRRN